MFFQNDWAYTFKIDYITKIKKYYFDKTSNRTKNLNNLNNLKII